MNKDGTIGPTVKIIWPWKLKAWQDPDGTWAGEYKYGSKFWRGWSGAVGVTGCESREEVIRELRDSLTSVITQDKEGKWVRLR